LAWTVMVCSLSALIRRSILLSIITAKDRFDKIPTADYNDINELICPI